jgi:hypothetical protein
MFALSDSSFIQLLSTSFSLLRSPMTDQPDRGLCDSFFLKHLMLINDIMSRSSSPPSPPHPLQTGYLTAASMGIVSRIVGPAVHPIEIDTLE